MFSLRQFPTMFRQMAVSAGQVRSFATAVCKELKIPVPWGHIAAKAWGSPCGLPILGLHGFRDNSATFDRLAPLLPPRFHLVAYDLPGCGQSTPLPAGLYPNLLTYLADVRRVLKFLGWTRSAVLGHSLGAATGLYYAATRPEVVTHLVCLDPAKWITGHSGVAPDVLKAAVDQMMDIEAAKRRPHRYPLEEAIRMAVGQSGNSLTRESAEVLLRRGCRVVDQERNLVEFNHDSKNKLVTMPMLDHEQTRAFASAAGSNVQTLVVSAEDGSVPGWAIEMDALPMPDFLPLVTSCSRVTEVRVPSTHHVHLNDPERVCEHIVSFLDGKSRLTSGRSEGRAEEASSQ